MKQPLRVLHLEDSRRDCELIEDLLLKAGIACKTKRVETGADFFDALQNELFDLILADCRLPTFSGLQALEIAQALRPEVPFIFVSGTLGEDKAIESLRHGATDYVLKERLPDLAPAVRRALAEAEERALFRELQQRLRRAGRTEAISTFSNVIARDFNDIATTILEHTSLLKTESHKPERVLEINTTIEHAALKASEIAQQLLAFARKSEGRVAPTDINRYVQDIFPLLRSKAPPTIALCFEPGTDLPKILGDPTQMERILINLLANSVKSMPDGGTITLSTKLVPSTRMPDLLSHLGNDKYVCLQVADTGKGMDEMTREHVFEPFYTTAMEPGRATGLELPAVYGLMQTVYELMQIQNGVVQVESKRGKGTTVSLFFSNSPAA